MYVTGRLVLTTIAVSILLVGPVMNISRNASELSAIPACTSELFYNQSLAIKHMAREPYIRFKNRRLLQCI